MNTWRVCVVACVMAQFAVAQSTVTPAYLPAEEEPHHHMLLKNESIVVLRDTLSEGESTLFHTHAHDRASVALSEGFITVQQVNELEGPPLARRPGDISVVTRGDGPYTHRVHNVGPGLFEVMDIEFLERPQQPSAAVAAPVAGENPSARVYKWILRPGATAAMHTHERPYLIIAATAFPLKMTAPDGQSFTHEMKPGDFHWVDAKVTHSLTNEGSAEAVIAEIELK